MNIFKIVTLIAVAIIMSLSCAEKGSGTPGGMELLKKDQALIDELEAKLQESSGKNQIISELIQLAKEMKELNNQRHQWHTTSKQVFKQYEDAVDKFAAKIKEISEKYDAVVLAFSKNIEAVIEKVTQVVTMQADSEIKNAKLQELINPSKTEVGVK